MKKHNDIAQKRMMKLCSVEMANKLGYMQGLNKETIKATGVIIERIEKLRPEKVRDQLYKVLEKFTTQHFNRMRDVDSEQGSAESLSARQQDQGRDSVLEELPPVEVPYLKFKPRLEYTLVLDLDETLIHYNEAVIQSARSRSSCVVEDDGGGFFRIRPFAREFLNTMAEYYEVVIFTCGTQDYADWVLDNLDTDKKIDFRLYR